MDEECLEHPEPHLKPWINNYEHHGRLDNQEIQRPLLPMSQPFLIPAMLLPTSH